MPAPPPLSEPAIVKALPTTALPSPVRAGSGSTGVISAPNGAPRWGEVSIGAMSVDVLRWEGLLQGEELAHLATESAREAQFAPVPDNLHPTARAALGVDSLYT